jgi:hypothetical protein
VRSPAAWLAVAAIALSAASLALTLYGRPAARYPLVCGMSFTDARTGRSAPMFVPCSPRHP